MFFPMLSGNELLKDLFRVFFIKITVSIQIDSTTPNTRFTARHTKFNSRFLRDNQEASSATSFDPSFRGFSNAAEGPETHRRQTS